MSRPLADEAEATARLLDGRASVCVGHISDCDCEACRTVRRVLRDALRENEERNEP